ncbi:MAG: arsenosugar biosynthesis radical SAM protein ArsS [Deltaproteobacteria bacterium]|nr:arsenosugar biosynthesis radical SAM protein ArsS [Deltaproteobacteria bacterium]
MKCGQLSHRTVQTSARRLPSIEPFHLMLARHGLELTRGRTTTLQINVGLLCNQACRHCHLEAGPDHKELMSTETVNELVALARRCHFETIDITGGAPEMNPNLAHMIRKLSPLAPRIMLRSNLTALTDRERDDLTDICKEHRVVIVASFPSLNEAQVEAQRGQGVFRKSIAAMQKLNSLGYGQVGYGLEIDLVCNPTGAFLPSPQDQTEKRFRQVLEKKWGVVFDHLFVFANVPLGRFRQWLERSGNLEKYIEKLASSFNHCAIEGLMCRTLVSVAWDGYFYDCDFNLARGLFMGGRKTHISEMAGLPELGSPIAVSDHCYTCTAGSGFT